MKNIFFVFYQDQLLIKNEARLFFPSQAEIAQYYNIQHAYLIGHFNQLDCFILTVTSPILIDNYTWMPLKIAMEKSGRQWYRLIARAYQIILWNNNHQFCGKCGNQTQKIAHQFERRCDFCHLSFFPKISPAIIVLIKKGNTILMARKKEFPKEVYGLIAGFSEAGETLEETLHRECYEEVGISVKNIQYFGSQSWPFPDSLMIAFTAEYDSGDIMYRDGEIEHADWYDAAHLPGFPSTSISIAQALIHAWLKGAC